MTIKCKTIDGDFSEFNWGMAFRKRHLFQVGRLDPDSACGTAYGGDKGIYWESKAKKCKLCEIIESRNK